MLLPFLKIILKSNSLNFPYLHTQKLFVLLVCRSLSLQRYPGLKVTLLETDI